MHEDQRTQLYSTSNQLQRFLSGGILCGRIHADKSWLKVAFFSETERAWLQEFEK